MEVDDDDITKQKNWNDVTKTRKRSSQDGVTSSSASEFSSSADSGFHFFQPSDFHVVGEIGSCCSNGGSPLPCVKVTGDGEDLGRKNKIWREKVDKETLAIIEV